MSDAARRAADPRLQRAYEYPYQAPDHDFVFNGRDAKPFDETVDLSMRQPVVAVGSNRAPEQLARKFGDSPQGTIPVTWAWLPDYDVVYCAHMASYGAVPATLHHSPGTYVRIAVTWLTEEQLERMHETESVGVNYVYGTFAEGAVDFGPGRPAVRAGCYITRRGALAIDGTPVALAEVEARNRRFRTLPQPEKLSLLHRHFGDHADEAAWILSLLGTENSARRLGLAERLSELAVGFEDPAFEIVLG